MFPSDEVLAYGLSLVENQERGKDLCRMKDRLVVFESGRERKQLDRGIPDASFELRDMENVMQLGGVRQDQSISNRAYPFHNLKGSKEPFGLLVSGLAGYGCLAIRL